MGTDTRLKFAGNGYATFIATPAALEVNLCDNLCDGDVVRGRVMSISSEGSEVAMRFKVTVGHSKNRVMTKYAYEWKPSRSWTAKGRMEPSPRMESVFAATLGRITGNIAFECSSRDPKIDCVDITGSCKFTWEDGAELLFVLLDSVDVGPDTDKEECTEYARAHNRRMIRAIAAILDRSADESEEPLAPDFGPYGAVTVTGYLPHEVPPTMEMFSFVADITPTGDGTVECTACNARSGSGTVTFTLGKDFTAFDLMRGIMDAADLEPNFSYGSIMAVNYTKRKH